MDDTWVEFHKILLVSNDIPLVNTIVKELATKDTFTFVIKESFQDLLLMDEECSPDILVFDSHIFINEPVLQAFALLKQFNKIPMILINHVDNKYYLAGMHINMDPVICNSLEDLGEIVFTNLKNTVSEHKLKTDLASVLDT